MNTGLAAGTRFGRYFVVRQLAIGGMAEIYLARIEGIGAFAKQVVLKRILAQFAQSEEFIQMFLHEARLAAGLQHANIVQVFDIGEIDGSYFFTMEYVHGHDLRSLIKTSRTRSERIPLEHALAIVADAAAGLHHAHEHLDESGRPLSIVHRDVSPSNIMVSWDGAVKVTDFGIAKAASQTVETRTGTLKGKVSYMSPEQCRGDPVDRRSDVFALGLVLHELVTGQKVLHGENDYAIIRKIVEQDAPRLDEVAPGDYPAELERIVARALARDRDRRYATAQELQLDLEALARERRLDGSATARARLLRHVFGTPPAGVEIDMPTIEVVEGSSSGAGTTPRRSEPTASTSIEVPGSSPPVATPRRRRWLVVALGLVAIAGSGAAWIALRDPPTSATGETFDAAPIVSATPDASTVAPASALDASVATPGATRDAALDATPDDHKHKPKPKPKPVPAGDPCKGWDPNSFAPPPEGCTPGAKP